MGPDQDVASAPGMPVDEFWADRPGAIQQMLINEGDALLVAQVCGCCKHAANGPIAQDSQRKLSAMQRIDLAAAGISGGDGGVRGQSAAAPAPAIGAVSTAS